MKISGALFIVAAIACTHVFAVSAIDRLVAIPQPVTQVTCQKVMHLARNGQAEADRILADAELAI